MRVQINIYNLKPNMRAIRQACSDLLTADQSTSIDAAICVDSSDAEEAMQRLSGLHVSADEVPTTDEDTSQYVDWLYI